MKEINLEKENIICSLREILISNLSNLELSYDDCLEVIILNKKREGYITIILGNWVQALLESEHNYQVGDKVKVRASLIKSNEVILTDY